MSPFLSGLMIGMTMFSALSLQWAQQELAAEQARKARADTIQARELAAALEFGILTEDRAAFTEQYGLDRAAPFAAATTQTRGGNAVQLNQRDVGSEAEGTPADPLGVGTTTVALTATDDWFARNAAAQQGEAVPLAGTATANVRGVRERQVLTSVKRMEAMAEQLYAAYAAELRFPDLGKFGVLDGRLKIRDAWGEGFDYQVTADGQQAELSFTTPWGHTQSMRLSLKE